MTTLHLVLRQRKSRLAGNKKGSRPNSTGRARGLKRLLEWNMVK